MCAWNVYLVPARQMELRDVDDDFDSGAEDDDEDNVMQAIEVSDDENEQHELQVVFETHPVDWQQAHDFSNYWPAEEARSLDMATEQWEQYNAEQRRLVYEALWHGFHKWLMASSALDETRFNEAVWELEHMEVLLHCFDLTSECGRFRVQFLFDTTPTRVLRVGIAYRGPACLILRSNFSDSDDEDEL